MSKIDLSKAKLGDKFRTKGGQILKYDGKDNSSSFDDEYQLIYENHRVLYYYRKGNFLPLSESEYDLIEQVFDDEKDRAITDKILKDVEKVTNGVAEAMPLFESAAIANLSREQLPENNEDDAELQRRQEVVELAEKLFTEKYLQEWYQYLTDNNTAKTDYITYIFEWAEKFVNAKDKYLKEGKL